MIDDTIESEESAHGYEMIKATYPLLKSEALHAPADPTSAPVGWRRPLPTLSQRVEPGLRSRSSHSRRCSGRGTIQSGSYAPVARG